MPDKVVQTKGDVEVTTPPPEKVETTEADQPTTEEKMTQMAVQLAKLEEDSTHWQSIADRDIKAARLEGKRFKRRAETAESQVNVFNQMVATNPQLASQVRAATTAAQSKAFRERENRDLAEQAKTDYFDKMTGIIEKFGIDPNDKRLDLAEDAEDSIVATDRIMSSISTNMKEDAKKADEKRSQELKDFEVRIRKDLGVDSADNTASSGAGTSSDADFIEKYGKGDLPFTQENLDRANKILNK